MRKLWMVVLALVVVPLLALAQYDTLKCNTDGVPESYFGGWGANAEGYVKLTPTSAQFRLDSIKIFGYRAAATVAAQLNIRIEIYSATGTPPNGTCGCTTGPGTLLRQYPSATGTYPLSWGTATGTKWFSILVPHDTLTGAFIVGIKYVSITGTGAYPSILWDNESALITCCDQYWNYQSAPGVRDNEAMFTTTPGPQYIYAKGWRIGAAAPGHLTTGTLEGMGGALLDSTVTDTLVLGNNGGQALTLLSITSSSPAFTSDALGTYVINPGQTRKLAVHYTPTAEGTDTTTLTFTDNVPGSQVSTKTLWGRGIAHVSTILYENWWNGNGYGDWPVYRFGADDSLATWALYYNGGHSDDFCNIAVAHDYTASGAPLVDDALMTPFLPAPASHNIRMNWREQTYYPSDVYLHGLLVADSDTNVYILDTLGLANTTQTWGDYPTTWYINGIDSQFSQFEVGFEYAGSYADLWYLDDIRVGDVPQLPPVLSGTEPHSDAFSTAHQIYCDAFDANSDPFTVRAYITPAGGGQVAYTLTETPIGSGHFCLPFSTFLSGAGSYSYYLVANDAGGQSRWPTTGSYTFEVQSQTGATELVHHNGTWFNAHYYNDMASKDAERFTPAGYPFLLTGAKIGILNGWPDYTHQQIQIQVYAGDGAGGMPGTLLYDQVTGSISRECAGFSDTTFANHYAEVCFYPAGIAINSGTFYIAVKNPAGAVAPNTEGWTFDSVGHGSTYYFDATNSTWSLQPDSNGTLMVSAIGFSQVGTPHIAAYPNSGNTVMLIHVEEADISGHLPFPMNLHVATSWTSPPALVPGSPFTTSPITYNYPAGSFAIFTGTYLYGASSLSVGLPDIEPVLPVSSVITPAPAGIRTATPMSAPNWGEKSTLPTRSHVPSVVVTNEVTGESVMLPFSKLGKPTSVSIMNTNRVHIGPVRQQLKGGFEALRIY